MMDIAYSKGRPVSEGDLHAYVDGQLDPARRAKVEAHLAAHPDDVARLHDYESQNFGLHVLFGGTEMYPNSEIDSLGGRFAQAMRRQGLLLEMKRVAAGIVLLVGVLGVGWLAHDNYTRSDDPFLAFTRQAVGAHTLFAGRNSAHHVVSDSNDSTVVSWLSQRLTGVPVRAPDLNRLGFNLAMERILPSANGPAAQLLYEHKDMDAPVTLFIGKSGDARQAAFTFVQNDDVSIFYWQTGSFAYSLAGRIERKKLLALAEAVSEQLNAPPPLPKRYVRSPAPAETAGVMVPSPDQPVATATVATPALAPAIPETGSARPAAKDVTPVAAPAAAVERQDPAAAAPPDAIEKPSLPPAAEEEKPKNT